MSGYYLPYGLLAKLTRDEINARRHRPLELTKFMAEPPFKPTKLTLPAGFLRRSNETKVGGVSKVFIGMFSFC